MLDGCRILVVEDEYLIAQNITNDLRDEGAVVLGPEPSVDRALTCVEREPRIDAAILDVNLLGEEVFPVADALWGRRIPFLFTTGYEDDVVRSRYPGAIVCGKPYKGRELLEAVAGLLANDARGLA